MDGFININKPAGFTSHDVVAVVRKTLSFKKIGHTGTLDPAATGVLPLCLGNATRLAEYITDCEKIYRAEILFGVTTTSSDADGQIIRQTPCFELTEAAVASAMKNFVGVIQQVPPMVSALKFNGKPLHQLARQGIEIERTPRKVTIYKAEIISYREGEQPVLTVEITCSKGTYIRSWANDLGESLGFGASLKSLIRLKVGQFELGNAYTLEELKTMSDKQENSFLIPMRVGISHLPVVVVENVLLNKVLCGNAVVLPHNPGDFAVCQVIDCANRLLGIGKTAAGVLGMNKVFNQE